MFVPGSMSVTALLISDANVECHDWVLMEHPQRRMEQDSALCEQRYKQIVYQFKSNILNVLLQGF